MTYRYIIVLSISFYANSYSLSHKETLILQEQQQREQEVKKRAEELQRREAEITRSLKEREDKIAQFREKPYREAIEKAARGLAVTTELEPITKDNPNIIWNKKGDRLLAVSWIPEDPYKRYYAPVLDSSTKALKTVPTFNILSWVTVVPQVKNFATDYLKSKENATTPL